MPPCPSCLISPNAKSHLAAAETSRHRPLHCHSIVHYPYYFRFVVEELVGVRNLYVDTRQRVHLTATPRCSIKRRQEGKWQGGSNILTANWLLCGLRRFPWSITGSTTHLSVEHFSICSGPLAQPMEIRLSRVQRAWIQPWRNIGQ